MEEKPKKYYYRFDEFEYNTAEKKRTVSGIRELDYLTKGFEMGCITIWTGLSNAGKTTVLTMLTKQTIAQGEKVFFFNGEQTRDDFKNNLYKQSVTKDEIYDKQYKETCIFDEYVREPAPLNRLYGDKLFVYNNEMPRDINSLLYAMEDCRRAYGVKVFILDNFMQIDIQSSDVFQEQTVIMEKLRTFAVNKGVHIHLVAHPRKVERNTNRLTLYDIAGSANLTNKAYNIVSITRVDKLDQDTQEYKKLANDMLKARYDITQASTILEVLKTKGNACGLVGLVFEPKTKSYTEQRKLFPEEYEKLKYQIKGGGNPF